MMDSKSVNRSAVLVELLASSPTTRVAVTAATKLSGATVTRVVDALIEEGLAHELHLMPASGRGRRAVLIEAVGEQQFSVGVDLGASNTRFVVMDVLGRVVLVHRVQTPTDLAPVALAIWLSELITGQLGHLHDYLGGIAVGLPGAVNPVTRGVSNAPHLSQIEDPEFVIALEESLGMAIAIDNDANYALLGERHFGVAREAPNAVMFTLGAGLGAGVAIDGRLVRGTHGLVGEFGSLPVGPLGSRLEHLVTGPGIMLRASELGFELGSPADLFQLSLPEPLLALRRQFEQALLVAITAAVVASDPEIVVLGGGIAPSLHGSIAELEAALQRNLRVSPRIAIAKLGDLSGALGAGVQGLHTIYTSMGVPPGDLARIPQRRELADLLSGRSLSAESTPV
jgi:predicted NBD/HSP70 family sugar kinase